MLSVYETDTAPLCDDELFERLILEVKPSRRKKIEKLRRKRDKRLSLAAGLLLKKALADHGIDYDEVIITVDENGKPSIPGSGLHFNLSHSDEKVLCAVSDRPVGCDVEKIEEIDIKIAKRFFAEEEYKIIAVSDDSQTEFYRIWTMKESFSKAIGLGLKLPLDSFTFEDGRVLQDAAPETYYVKVSVTDDGYCRAVCSEYDEPCVITEYIIK